MEMMTVEGVYDYLMYVGKKWFLLIFHILHAKYEVHSLW